MPSNQRIAFFISSMEGGGAERVILNLVNYYAQQGYQVDLLLANSTGVYLNEVSSDVRIIDLKVKRFWHYFFPIASYLRKEKPEAILVATTILNLITLVASRMAFTRTKVVVSEHSDLVAFADIGLLRRANLLKSAIRFIYPLADNIVAVSNGVADSLVQFSGIKRSSIEVVYNGVMDENKIKLSKKSLNHPLFNDDNQILIAVGRLQKGKGYSYLLEAFSKFLDQSPNPKKQLKLVVLGEGELRAELEAQMDELDIAEHCYFPGFVDNPFQYLANSDVFVLPSEFEGLPTVLIEALACGCSVISTDCPSGPDEILQSGKYGRLVPIKDSESLANSLLETLVKGDVCSKRQRQERGMYFSVDAAVENYSRVLGLAE